MKLVPKPGTSVATNDGPASRIFQAIGMPSASRPATSRAMPNGR